MFSPESPNFASAAEREACRPSEIFNISDQTTDIICCVHGEIASPSLVYAARKEGLDQISCLAGGLTGLVFYLKHTINDSDSILGICHPQFQLPTFKNKLDRFVHEDTGDYMNFHDYYRDFFRAPNIQKINIISHSEGFAKVLHMSELYQYLDSCFPEVKIYDSYFKVAERYNIKPEDLQKARATIKPKAVKIEDTSLSS
ncbi:MAG: hypothetical protein Q4G02_02215 [bacterium]|nr:hypothetical protein [bacterium]